MQNIRLLMTIFCTLILFQTFSMAQNIEYSDNPEQFYKQLEEQFSKTQREASTQALESFVTNAQAGKFNSSQLSEIIATCNMMGKKRMRTFPHFTNYFMALNVVVESARGSSKFDAWHAIVKDFTNKADKGKFAKVTSFLDFSTDFFTSETLFKTAGKQWVMQSLDYDFVYENDTAYVNISEGSLFCYTPRDTLSIIDTKGDYYPLTKKWKGKLGKVTWDRVNFDPNEIYCEIGKYDIDLTKAEYRVNDAIFYHKKYFSRPLKGKLVDRISSRVGDTYLYPEFVSHDTDIMMDNLVPQAKFVGGFSLEGSKIVGFGSSEKRAKMYFYAEDGRLVLTARGNRFGVKENDVVNAQQTAVSLYFGEDSLYHPRLNLKYLMSGEKELRLVRDGKASSKIAFMSSYHHLEANVDAIFWKLNQPVIDFKMVSQRKDLTVFFESYNLYEPARLDQYKRVTDVDPVARAADYASGGTFTVHIEDFAKYINGNYNKESILSSVFAMVKDGFVYYDPDSDMITIRPKALNYLDAKKGNIDYDRILLVSQGAKQENAQLDLESKTLLVTGVEKITLSDSQQVVIYPYKGITSVKKNRDMDVDGTIIAGSVDLVGKNFGFQYAPFKIDMDTVEQMQVYIAENVQDPNSEIVPISTLIQDVSGTLFIDKEDNKSGLIDHPNYPSFKSSGNSFLYYDSRKLYDGTYNRDEFYFKLDPFTFNDLDNISPDILTFPGTMVTDGIFPDFKQETSLQEDMSLGFSKTTNAAGMKTYGKGKFTGGLSMSNKGLVANGRMDYMAATLLGESFIMMPDSMLAAADSFYQIRKTVQGIEFPHAHNGAVKVKWYPAGDSMMVTMKNKPFDMFEDRVKFKGTILVSGKGSRGSGTMTFDQASIRSKDFVYTSSTFKADSSDVVIKNKDAAKVAFNSYNVKSRVDLDQMLGEFLANGDQNIPIVLPYNQYKTVASEYYWLMNDQLINIRMPEDENLSYFESTHPDQDGLKFPASGGVVDLANNTIKIDGIPYIPVADAKVRPPDTQVFIEGDADIRKLEGALMVMDTANEYHKIYKLDIKIRGLNDFEGSGEYRYKGKDMKKQKIKYDLIVPVEDTENKENKGKFYTSASTEIKERKKFKLSNNINYKGKAILDSRSPFLIFDGFAKIDLITEAIEAEWFAFKDAIDPENIKIDVSTPVAETTDTLIFGMMQDMSTLVPYPAFLSRKRTPLDAEMFRTGGSLEFDDAENIFRVGDKKRLEDKVSKGNILTLQDEDGKVGAKGAFAFGDFGGFVRGNAGGDMLHDVATGETTFSNMTVALDFLIDDGLLESISETIRYYNAEAPEVDYSDAKFFDGAVALVDDKKVGDFKSMMNSNGYMSEKVKGLDHQFIFSNVEMVFDTSLHTIRSVGKLGLGFCGEKYVNRAVDGFIEFGLRQSGDYFRFYIETPKDEYGVKKWWFFTYKNGKMEVVSSDIEFNEKLNKVKEKKRIQESKKTGEVYQYSLAPKGKQQQFMVRMLGEAAASALEVKPTPSTVAPVDSLGNVIENAVPQDDSVTPNDENTDTENVPNNPATPEDANMTDDERMQEFEKFLDEKAGKGKKKKKKKKGKKGKGGGSAIEFD
ncbi:MAG: hypothetical protein ACPG5B_01150 [Chitinophagales bacterium]